MAHKTIIILQEMKYSKLIRPATDGSGVLDIRKAQLYDNSRSSKFLCLFYGLFNVLETEIHLSIT